MTCATCGVELQLWWFSGNGPTHAKCFRCALIDAQRRSDTQTMNPNRNVWTDADDAEFNDYCRRETR